MLRYPNILTIAGSDSGGGAGIQADIKTMTCLHGFGMSVITALTAQNGEGVTGIHAVPADFVVQQYTTVRDGFKIHAAKTGMLCNGEIMHELAAVLKNRDFPLVVDPVCVSESGHRLVEESAISTLREEILPLADLITPNIPETEVLVGFSVGSYETVEAAAAALHKLGAKAVLVKGGHFNDGKNSNAHIMTDWLSLGDGRLIPLSHPRVTTPNTHGTGCTLSAAIATFIGAGNDIGTAVSKAQLFLVRALETSFTPGKGVGPVNFLEGAKQQF